jgi:hypothetical protein
VEVELRLVSGGTVSYWLAARSFGLPDVPGKQFQPRPPDQIAGDGSDTVLVGRQGTF